MDFLIEAGARRVLARMVADLDGIAEEVANHFDRVSLGSARVLVYAPEMTRRNGVDEVPMLALPVYELRRAVLKRPDGGFNTNGRFWEMAPEALLRVLIPRWEAGIEVDNHNGKAMMATVLREVDKRWDTLGRRTLPDVQRPDPPRHARRELV